MHSSNNELLHPLWLGLLILFTVVLLLALLCCLRRHCAPSEPVRAVAPPVRPSSSNVFLPPPSRRSPSPKLYQLLKTMKTAAAQKEQPAAAEVARKFYASMRYANPSTETIDASPLPDKAEPNLRLFRTPRFFQSIADSGLPSPSPSPPSPHVNVVLDQCTLNI